MVQKNISDLKHLCGVIHHSPKKVYTFVINIYTSLQQSEPNVCVSKAL